MKKTVFVYFAGPGGEKVLAHYPKRRRSTTALFYYTQAARKEIEAFLRLCRKHCAAFYVGVRLWPVFTESETTPTDLALWPADRDAGIEPKFAARGHQIPCLRELRAPTPVSLDPRYGMGYFYGTTHLGRLVVHHSLVRRLRQHGVSGYQVEPALTSGGNGLEISVSAGSLQSTLNCLQKYPKETQKIGAGAEGIAAAVEASISDALEEKRRTELDPERLWLTLSPDVAGTPAYEGFLSYLARLERRDEILYTVFEPPAEGPSWFHLTVTGGIVKELDRTEYNPETRCPTCGGEMALKGPLYIDYRSWDGSDFCRTDRGGWILISKRVRELMKDVPDFEVLPAFGEKVVAVAPQTTGSSARTSKPLLPTLVDAGDIDRMRDGDAGALARVAGQIDSRLRLLLRLNGVVEEGRSSTGLFDYVASNTRVDKAAWEELSAIVGLSALAAAGRATAADAQRAAALAAAFNAHFGMGYSPNCEPHPCWEKEGLVCNYEHCIEWMPFPDGDEGEEQRGCPKFGHCCPGGPEAVRECRERR